VGFDGAGEDERAGVADAPAEVESLLHGFGAFAVVGEVELGEPVAGRFTDGHRWFIHRSKLATHPAQKW